MPSHVRMEMRARRRGRHPGVASINLALVGLLVVGCAHVPGVYTYVGKKSGAAAAGGGSFDATTYAKGIFASKIVPTVHAKAIEADTLLSAIKANADAAGKKYGTQSGIGSPFSYMIKGTGTVSKVDPSDATGPVTVRVDGPGGFTVVLVTGPVILGTDIRDAVGFIDFSQFTNQIDYADVATQINAQAKAIVLAKLDKATLTGKKVAFEGAFSLTDPSDIEITPTALTVSP